jgi:hypothetical protein
VAQQTAAIPAPEADDPDTAAMSLETAKALWGIGDKQEAIRWLRRAADALEQAGNDLRAVKLARTAAELTSEIEAEVSITRPPAAVPGSTPPPAALKSRPPPLPPSPGYDPAPLSPSSTAASNRPRTHPPPLPPPPTAAAPVVAEVRPQTTTSRRPPPPPSAKRSMPPPAPSSKERAPSQDAAIAQEPAPRQEEASTSHAASVTSAEPAVSTPVRSVRARPPSTAGDAEPGTQVWHAARVSVKRSSRDPNLYVVRRIEQGKNRPPGTREALILLLDASTDLLDAPPEDGRAGD